MSDWEAIRKDIERIQTAIDSLVSWINDAEAKAKFNEALVKKLDGTVTELHDEIEGLKKQVRARA